MPTGVAVACDGDECLAVYLGVETGDDEDARSASEVSQMARDAAQGDGWVISFGFRQPVMTCPGRDARAASRDGSARLGLGGLYLVQAVHALRTRAPSELVRPRVRTRGRGRRVGRVDGCRGGRAGPVRW